jgi:hypothetical protein
MDAHNPTIGAATRSLPMVLRRRAESAISRLRFSVSLTLRCDRSSLPPDTRGPPAGAAFG